MTRWILAAFVVGLAALALLRMVRPVPAASTLPAPTDEILAYRLREGAPLAIKLPPEVEAAVLTTWALGDPLHPCDPTLRRAYALHAELSDDAGRVVTSRAYELESRESCDPSLPADRRDYAARLDDGAERVLDPRTTTLLLGGALPRGGALRVRLATGGAEAATEGGGVAEVVREVLLRIEGRYRRGDLEGEAHERSLDVTDRQRIVAGRASLGFVDLPERARQEAVSGWARRLEAVGREGVDYAVRRLLLRDYRVPLPPPPPRSASFPIGTGHAAALSLAGPTRLEVIGPPEQLVRVTDGPEAPVAVRLSEAGRGRIDLLHAAPRTVAIEALGEDVPARFELPAVDARYVLGAVAVTPSPGGMVAVSPDVRVVRFAKLDPERPVVARIAPGQEVLAIAVRAELAKGDLREDVPISLSARFTAPRSRARERVSGQLVLRRSRFERWRDGGDATDARVAILNVPPGVAHVEITGDAAGRVQLRAVEPGVDENVLVARYREPPLPEGLVWRHAPLEARRFTPVAPDFARALEQEGRMVELIEQARVEPALATHGPPRPERSLPPEGAPLRRRLLVQAWHPKGAPFPPDAWTPLERGDARDIVVGDEGARAARVNVLYRADPEVLGNTVALKADGATLASESMLVLSGVLRGHVSPGQHRVWLEGLGARGVAYCDAAPAEGGPILRRRDVFELRPGSSLELAIRQGPSETLTLNLFVVAEKIGLDWAIHYAIDQGRPKRETSRFFRVVTKPSGLLAGKSGDAGRGLLWEARVQAAGGSAAPHGISKAKIRFGDDLSPGLRRVVLRLDRRSTPLWLAAVLYGQAPPQEGPSIAMWPEDE